MKSIFSSEQDHLSFMTKFMAKKCSRSAVNIEVLAMLSNDLSNKRCSCLSCGHDVLKTVGGKVVGWMHNVFLLVKPSLLAASEMVSFQDFAQNWSKMTLFSSVS